MQGRAKIRKGGIALKLQQRREAEDEGREGGVREGKRGEQASRGVTREDMLQIKSFGTKEDCCQATQPERGYQGN